MEVPLSSRERGPRCRVRSVGKTGIMRMGIAVFFGHGLVIDLVLWAGMVGLAWVVNAAQSRSEQQRLRTQRLLWVVAAFALAVLLVLDL
jgi:hypothetical protein